MTRPIAPSRVSAAAAELITAVLAAVELGEEEAGGIVLEVHAAAPWAARAPASVAPLRLFLAGEGIGPVGARSPVLEAPNAPRRPRARG